MLRIRQSFAFLTILLWAALPVAGCTRGPAHQWPREDPAGLRPIVDAILLPEVQSRRLPGVAVGIIVDGTTQWFTYGRMSLPCGKAPDNHTVFEIGSITKTITCQVLAQMVAEGLVQIDQPVSDFTAPVALPMRDGVAITFEHLATHTSGIPYMPDGLDPLPLDDLWTPFDAYSEEVLLEWISHCELLSTPGEQYRYSNAAMSLLGNVLASIEHKSFAELIQDRVLGPLGMTHTAIPAHEVMRPLQATGHTPLFNLAGFYFNLPMPHWNLHGLGPSGGINSTLDDMLAFLRAAMGQDPVQQEAFELVTRPRFEIAPTLRIGLGWHHYVDPNGGEPIIWHNGATAGFSSFLGFKREARIGIVILSNSGDQPDQQALDLIAELTRLKGV
jgi:D-alanyl-D-alanine-carboxypeptidase/D-alanyl-D-alanine-endopeptidase